MARKINTNGNIRVIESIPVDWEICTFDNYCIERNENEYFLAEIDESLKMEIYQGDY